jgi:transcriptional regulator with XRE-family HTH domain
MQRKTVIDLILSKQGNRTRGELAAELGISPGHLSEILSGKKNPGEKAVRNLKGIKASKKTCYEAAR